MHELLCLVWRRLISENILTLMNFEFINEQWLTLPTNAKNETQYSVNIFCKNIQTLNPNLKQKHFKNRLKNDLSK